MFFENIKTLNHNYKQITTIKSKSAKQFYDSLIVINDINDQYVLLNEATSPHQDVQFNKSLINKIYNAPNFTQIQSTEVFERSPNSIKENYSIKLDIPMYIFNFSFSKHPETICSIFSSFNIPFTADKEKDKQNITLKEKYQIEVEEFKNNVQDAFGLCSDQQTCVLIILNQDRLCEKAVIHELYHYLQIILQKDVSVNKQIQQTVKFSPIPSLQFDQNDLFYLLDKWEFETHIKVDLCNQLQQMYFTCYKHLSKSEFISRFIKAVESDPNNVVTNFFYILIKLKNRDTTPLRLFAACFLLKDKYYLLTAINWLEQAFK